MTGGERTADGRTGVREERVDRAKRLVRNAVDHLYLDEGVAESAATLLDRWGSSGEVVRHSTESVAAACVLIAARHSGTAVPVDALSVVFDVDDGEVWQVFRLLQDNVGIDPGVSPSIDECMRWMARAIGVDEGEMVRVGRVVWEGFEDDFSGRSPWTVAGSVTYAVGQREGWGLTQEDVTEVAGVNYSALRRSPGRGSLVEDGALSRSVKPVSPCKARRDLLELSVPPLVRDERAEAHTSPDIR